MVLGEGNNNGQFESFLKEQLDAEEICDKTGMILRGYRFDPNQAKFTNIVKTNVQRQKENSNEIEIVEVEYINQPLLSEEGIKQVLTELRPRISNVFQSSSLTNQEIATTRHSVAMVLWKKLRKHRKDYDLSLEAFESILFMVDDQLMLFLSRAEKGGFLQTLKKMVSTKENVNISQDQTGNTNKGGLFN